MNILELLEKLEQASQTYFQGMKKGGNPEDASSEALENIRNDFKTCLEYGDEKVALAVQTYEMVSSKTKKSSILHL
jgi:hypothetical protein